MLYIFRFILMATSSQPKFTNSGNTKWQETKCEKDFRTEKIIQNLINEQTNRRWRGKHPGNVFYFCFERKAGSRMIEWTSLNYHKELGTVLLLSARAQLWARKSTSKVATKATVSKKLLLAHTSIFIFWQCAVQLKYQS